MKVIFLDFDGVLVTGNSLRAGTGKPRTEKTSADCVAALNLIVENTGAVVVVSSTWRLGFEIVELRELLRAWGFQGGVIDKTPRLFVGNGNYQERERGHEIQWWLDEYAEHGREDVEAFVILDDDADMVHLMDHLVQTDFMDGLTMEHAERAIALLTTAKAAESSRE